LKIHSIGLEIVKIINNNLLARQVAIGFTFLIEIPPLRAGVNKKNLLSEKAGFSTIQDK
jgi:hypothetical protein